MIDKTDTDISTRLTALLSLVASTIPTTGSCPSDQQLADYIQGQLKHKTQQRVLTHLNNCPDCRQIWLDTAAYLDTIALEQTDELAKTSPFSGFSAVKQSFANKLNPWSLATASLATAAILVILLWPSSYTLEQRINTGYDTLAIADQPALRQVVRTFVMPWDNTVMGFSQTRRDPQILAFGAGLWDGKNTLLTPTAEWLPELLVPPDNIAWSSSQWAKFYQLGRWLFLLWVETNTEARSVNWVQHAEMLQQQTNQFEGAIASTLLAIDTKLQNLITSQNPAREQNQLRRLLETTIQKYAPD